MTYLPSVEKASEVVLKAASVFCGVFIFLYIFDITFDKSMLYKNYAYQLIHHKPLGCGKVAFYLKERPTPLEDRRNYTKDCIGVDGQTLTIRAGIKNSVKCTSCGVSIYVDPERVEQI